MVIEVVVVEQAARFLLGAVAPDHRARERQHRAGAGAGDNGAAAIEQRADALLLARKAAAEVGVAVAQALGGDARLGIALGGAEDREQRREAVRSGRGAHGRQPVRLVAVGFGALGQDRDQRRPFRRGISDASNSSRSTLSIGLVRGDPERLRQLRHRAVDTAGAVQPSDHLLAVLDRLGQGELEREIARQRDDGRERAAFGAVGLGRCGEQHVEPDRLDHLLLLRLFQHLEARGDVGLERECCSSRVQKAWMVCTFRPPGVSSASANSLRARASRLASMRLTPVLRISFSSASSLERGPAGEPLEHAVRHVGGRRLGVGEAEDLRRVGAVEQQADHALRQHVGLAGAGIGRHPRRRRRIGRLVLYRRARHWG